MALAHDLARHPAPNPPEICILMAVWNGADYLPHQLQSIALQSHGRWHLVASDDGSTDDTLSILRRFADFGHRVTCLPAPSQQDAGYAAATENFMSLIRRWPQVASPNSWMAFADQDDIWLPDKLDRAITALQNLPPGQPAMYCSRTWIADANGVADRLSNHRPLGPSFNNALVQNIAHGNTIVLNAAAATLAHKAAQTAPPQVSAHDWWLYLLMSGAGAHIISDAAPTLLYRQHGRNLVGANDTIPAKVKRVLRMLRGDFEAWNTMNIQAMTAARAYLTPANQRLLDQFTQMRRRPLLARLQAMHRLPVYRQTRGNHAMLWLATLLRRV